MSERTGPQKCAEEDCTVVIWDSDGVGDQPYCSDHSDADGEAE